MVKATCLSAKRKLDAQPGPKADAEHIEDGVLSITRLES